MYRSLDEEKAFLDDESLTPAIVIPKERESVILFIPSERIDTEGTMSPMKIFIAASMELAAMPKTDVDVIMLSREFE